MKKEQTKIEIDDREKTYRAELRKARWCKIAGKGAAIAPLIAAGVLSRTSKLEQTGVMVRIDTDIVAGMVATLGWAIGSNRSHERTEDALREYSSNNNGQEENT